MERVKRFLLGIRGVYWYVAGWFIVNLFFLTNFPFMHSDESWLSGLTRSMMQGGLDSTETFFDLMPRYPHAIKTIFHLLQMGFIKIFGYNLFSVRLLSMIAAAVSLILLYKIGTLFLKNNKTAFWAMVFLSISTQFVYATHFARQEIIILMGMLLVVHYTLKNTEKWTWKNDAILAVMTGAFIGVHPNSFLIALCAGSLYLYRVIIKDRSKWKNLLLYILFTGIMAGIFIGISYIFDGNFITHYLKYGSDLGVQSSFSLKTEGLLYYYQKLFTQTSVTYYTPNIRAELIIFALVAIGTVTIANKKRHMLTILLPLLAVNLGFIIIGRYSQPGIVLIFPFGTLLIFALLEQSKKTNIVLASALLCAAILANTVMGVVPYLNNDYKDYINNISQNIPKDAVVLANLNSEYAYQSSKMYDYRNLVFLSENNGNFGDYITSGGIEYIIYPEEMDFIYERRPVWNVVYGNLYLYYEDMTDFIYSKCELVYSFETPYAMRMVQFADDKDWTVKIYKVKKDE